MVKPSQSSQARTSKRAERNHQPDENVVPASSKHILLGLGLLSAAVLSFEINLTRLFSVGQFYHFAFLIVSIALLGNGASGSFLFIFPQLGRGNIHRILALLSLACSISIFLSYLLTNWLPFDSFRLAIDFGQFFILAFHFVALSLPFFMCGLATSILLARRPQAAGKTYAANLLGSALGCLIALITPALLSGEGVVIFSSGLAAMPALYLSFSPRRTSGRSFRYSIAVLASIVIIFCLTDMLMRLNQLPEIPGLAIKLSPYKGLSYALQYPGAHVISTNWNSFSRVDVVRSPGIHSLPGLSYRYLDPPPKQDGVLVDGDDLSPIVLPGESWQFAGYLPAALPFQLKRQAATLILEPRGGLDLITAINQGAATITAVEGNPLVIRAAAHIYQNPAVNLVVESDRSFLRRSREKYDVIIRSLASSYQPVRSGAYSLAEEYAYTLESFEDALTNLTPDGILFVQRWLQTPPTEEIRIFGMGAAALEKIGKDPRQHIVAIRGYNTAAVLVKNSPFTPTEIGQIREFCDERSYDLIYAPGLTIEETNSYNILLEDIYYQNFQALLAATPRAGFYRAYPFEISPPTDDRPFFGHFFKWSQAKQILAELGKTWQPFGGAGYFVLVLLLLLAAVVSMTLILAPIAIIDLREKKQSIPRLPNQRPGGLPGYRYWISYFALLGFGFLLVEIPLVQRFMLYLDHPAYAFAAVVFSLLLFSAAGSRLSASISLKYSLLILSILLAIYTIFLPVVLRFTMGMMLPWRLLLTVLLLAPAGLLMGIPFPGGIQRLGSSVKGAALIPWVWAINGTASVIAAVLAALLALSYGYTFVLWLGAGCYMAAWFIGLALAKHPPADPEYPTP